jgi:hypothetical protein
MSFASGALAFKTACLITMKELEQAIVGLKSHSRRESGHANTEKVRKSLRD